MNIFVTKVEKNRITLCLDEITLLILLPTLLPILLPTGKREIFTYSVSTELSARFRVSIDKTKAVAD